MRGRKQKKDQGKQQANQSQKQPRQPDPIELQPKKSYYDTLGIPPDADQATIKSAYRKLALRWHPDKNAEDLQQAEKMMKELNAAYKVLSNEQSKKKYDYHIQHHDPTGDPEESDDDWEQMIVVDPKIILRNWVILWAVWVILLGLDWLLPFSLSWIVQFLVHGVIYYLFKESTFRGQAFFVKFVIDTLLYLVLPDTWAAKLSNVAFYAFAIIFQNFWSYLIQIDVSAITYLVLVTWEYYRHVPTRLTFFAVSSMTLSFILIVASIVFGLFRLPKAPSYIVRSFNYLPTGTSAYFSLILWVPFCIFKLMFGLFVFCFCVLIGVAKTKLEWFLFGILLLYGHFEEFWFSSLGHFTSLTLCWLIPSVLAWAFIPHSVLQAFNTIVFYTFLLWSFRIAEIDSEKESRYPTHLLFYQGKWISPAYLAMLLFYLFIDFYFWSTGPLSQIGIYFGTFVVTVMICCMIQQHTPIKRSITPLLVPGVATFGAGKALIQKFLSEQKAFPDTKFARRQQAKRNQKK